MKKNSLFKNEFYSRAVWSSLGIPKVDRLKSHHHPEALRNIDWMETPVTLQISRYGLWESRTCEYTDSSNNVSLVCWKINQLSHRNMPRAFGWNFPIFSLFFIQILMKAPWDTNSIETSLTVINAVQGFKKTLMANWSLIENQPLLKENTSDYNYPTSKSLKHMPLRWKNIIWRKLIIRRNHKKPHWESAQVCLWLPF